MNEYSLQLLIHVMVAIVLAGGLSLVYVHNALVYRMMSASSHVCIVAVFQCIATV